jgi:hypothetical protein
VPLPAFLRRTKTASAPVPPAPPEDPRITVQALAIREALTEQIDLAFSRQSSPAMSPLASRALIQKLTGSLTSMSNSELVGLFDEANAVLSGINRARGSALRRLAGVTSAAVVP